MPLAKRCFSIVLLLLLAVQLSACLSTGKKEKWKPLKRSNGALVHTVQWPEENLAMVALWYTGSEKNLERIANGNPNIVASQLQVNDRIFIEPGLLVKRTPLNHSFIEQYLAPPPPPSPPKPAPSLQEQQDPEPQDPVVLTPRNSKKRPAQVTIAEPSSPQVVQSSPLDEDFQLFGPK